MCGHSFTLRQSLSLSLLFLLLSGLCFNLFCFVMEKWESALKYMGGIGFGMNDRPLLFLVFEIVYRFGLPSALFLVLNYFLCSSSMIYLSLLFGIGSINLQCRGCIWSLD